MCFRGPGDTFFVPFFMVNLRWHGRFEVDIVTPGSGGGDGLLFCGCGVGFFCTRNAVLVQLLP